MNFGETVSLVTDIALYICIGLLILAVLVSLVYRLHEKMKERKENSNGTSEHEEAKECQFHD